MPSGTPHLVAARLTEAAAELERLSGLTGIDGPGLLSQRRVLPSPSRVSAGGASRLLPTADGWLAATLSRPDDVELVPAWLEIDGESWDDVARAVAPRPTAPLVDRGQELGLAVAALPGAELDQQLVARGDPGPCLVTPGEGTPVTGRPRVVDLSAMWAGPLCAHLLHLAGAEVVTVESPSRPDGTRVGDPQLHTLLHEGCQPLQLDLRSPQLQELIDSADVVITSARPRALRQLDLWPPDVVGRRPGLTWVAITGYGLTGPWCDRVAYGDDAAVAGGLVGDGPVFFADAAADPATGLHAAVAALSCLQAGGGLVDIALREVARHLARPA